MSPVTRLFFFTVSWHPLADRGCLYDLHAYVSDLWLGHEIFSLAYTHTRTRQDRLFLPTLHFHTQFDSTGYGDAWPSVLEDFLFCADSIICLRGVVGVVGGTARVRRKGFERISVFQPWKRFLRSKS